MIFLRNYTLRLPARGEEKGIGSEARREKASGKKAIRFWGKYGKAENASSEKIKKMTISSCRADVSKMFSYLVDKQLFMKP